MRMKRQFCCSASLQTVCVATILILSYPVNILAFSISPKGTDNEDRIISFNAPRIFKWTDREFRNLTMELFTTPVHERATNIVYGCADDPDHPKKCSDPKTRYAPMAVLAGNQWNDNPPFELTTTNTDSCQKYVGKTIKAPYAELCWYTLFRDAAKRSAKGEFFDATSGNVLLYRVHFGDMQFLHSMATKDGEEAQVTKDKIMMWAEFTYKVATGALPRSIVLNQTGIPGMKELFSNRGWTAQQLFIRGDGTYHAERDFRDFVFGSLLHMVQDSFTASHTERYEPTGTYCNGSTHLFAPGKIAIFLSYAKQNSKKHAEMDTQDALTVDLSEVPPSAVDVGKALKALYERSRPWDEVKQYLECVFDLDDSTAKAGPSKDYQ